MLSDVDSASALFFHAGSAPEGPALIVDLALATPTECGSDKDLYYCNLNSAEELQEKYSRNKYSDFTYFLG